MYIKKTILTFIQIIIEILEILGLIEYISRQYSPSVSLLCSLRTNLKAIGHLTAFIFGFRVRKSWEKWLPFLRSILHCAVAWCGCAMTQIYRLIVC